MGDHPNKGIYMFARAKIEITEDGDPVAGTFEGDLKKAGGTFPVKGSFKISRAKITE